MNWLDASDILFGIYIGIWWTQNFYKPVLPVKVTILPPEAPKAPSTGWRASVEPLVVQLHVSSSFCNQVVYKPESARVIRALISDMATKLDRARDQGCEDVEPKIHVKTVSKPVTPT